MNAPRLDALAGRLLERARSGHVDPPHPENRRQAILLVERAIRRKSRRRAVVRASFAAAAMAVLGLGLARFGLHRAAPLAAQPPRTAAGIVVVGHPTGGGATVVQTGTQAPLTEGRSLPTGSRIRARLDGHVVLSVSTGTELTVEEGGEVSIVDSGPSEVFAVHAGAIRAEVAKLHPGQRFIIRTPDSEVEVRGTSFRVAVTEGDPACEGGTVTRVSVFEGVVSVRHSGEEARITAGGEWPNGCTGRKEPPAEARGEKARLGARRPASGPSSQIESVRPSSDLAEQNDCMARAFAAKRRGAIQEAIQGFETFVARYPTSSLVESALAERMRLLRGVDAARAVKAAEQYLSRYPKGFARSEAEAVFRMEPR
jgi:hypothetical protein